MAFYTSVLYPGKTCPLCWSLHGTIVRVGTPEYYMYMPKMHNSCWCDYHYFSSLEFPALGVVIKEISDDAWLKHAYKEKIPIDVLERYDAGFEAQQRLFGAIEGGIIIEGMTSIANDYLLDFVALAAGAGYHEFSKRRALKYARRIAEIEGHNEVWGSDMIRAIELAKYPPDIAAKYFEDEPELLKLLEEVLR